MTPAVHTRPLTLLLGSLMVTSVLTLVGAAIHSLPSAPEFTALQEGPCIPGVSNFTSSQPPEPPGEWTGNRGYFVIPGSVELNYCRPGRLKVQARGDLASNGGAPLLAMTTDAGQREAFIHEPQIIELEVGASGRVILAFPNDETDALYRIVSVERLAVVGRTRCRSTLIRDQQRTPFQGATTVAVYDLKGQQLKPCEPGDLYLTVSGSAVNRTGPHLLIEQDGKTLLNQEIRGRASFRLPLTTVSTVQLSVTNFAGRKVLYRNLFIDGVEFTPATE